MTGKSRLPRQIPQGLNGGQYCNLKSYGRRPVRPRSDTSRPGNQSGGANKVAGSGCNGHVILTVNVEHPPTICLPVEGPVTCDDEVIDRRTGDEEGLEGEISPLLPFAGPEFPVAVWHIRVGGWLATCHHCLPGLWRCVVVDAGRVGYCWVRDSRLTLQGSGEKNHMKVRRCSMSSQSSCHRVARNRLGSRTTLQAARRR